MNILTIDTTTAVTALSLCTGARLTGESFLHTERPHSERVLPLIEQLLDSCGLRPADLDLIGVARGPGSFTGIRIGIATAQGLAQALGIPALGLCSLDIMSWAGWGRPEDIVVLLDARRDEWYMARYRWASGEDGWRREPLEAPQAVAVSALAARLAARPGDVILAGDGAERAGRELAGVPGARVRALPPEAALARGAYAAREARRCLAQGAPSGEGAALWQVEPYYIRLPEAEVRARARAAGEAAGGRDAGAE
ncbi:MAG: tRNA (adenosine(37)-N6)-threonylcarbamoyltransferase complex dimerization subunit type 1 TsaB [Gracilibacteraceae bacterium]|jgi:tRNA threonylcarbamoyladenosine biosynthesis protein TsaB|nr:tRNA (adenosine(37)-N6)-threonylcarbamoyltransferase complex dimerization subunit type 1 TsaB [Gracilibacteraceae bacterium]